MKATFIRSIGFKILIFYILLALINVSFIISIIFENQVELISKNSKLEAEQQISNLIDSLKKFSSEMGKGTLFANDKDQKSLDQFITLIRPYAPLFFIITENNRILYKSNKTLTPPPTLAEDVLRSVTTINFSGKEYFLRIDDRIKILYCYIPLSNFQMGNAILLVMKDISSLDTSLRNLYYQAIYAIVVALFFHAVFALILFRYIIIPIRLLRQGARKLAGGDFSARISLDERNDELGSLAQSFNRMADSIHENVITLSGKAEHAMTLKSRADALTVRDELTGLYSRTYMLERINEEELKTSARKSSAALLIIDIDNFWDIVKIFGNNTRDIILLEISKMIIRNCSETDVISRYSEENIAVLTTDCSIEHVKNLSEKIRQAIEAQTIITPDGHFSVTVSVGVSFINFGSGIKPAAANALISSAETALAQAKQMGKNRVGIIS